MTKLDGSQVGDPCPLGYLLVNPILTVWFAKIISTVNIRLKPIFSSPEPLGSQGELIVYPSSRRPSVRRPSVRPSVVVNNFKHLLLRNRWADQSQILCGASLGRGNDILFAALGSHDQDGRHAHIW